MAKTLTELQAFRDQLMVAVGSSTLEVQTGDKRVRYKSVDEIQTAIRILDREIAQLSGASVRTIRVVTSKGV